MGIKALGISGSPVKNSNTDRLVQSVLTGLEPKVLDHINRSLAAEIKEYERMDLVGQLTVQGNLPCLTCGEGDECKMSAVKIMYGPDAKTSDFGYSRVENQKEVWESAARMGRLIGERLHKK
jgi:hypothetical protein